MTNTNIKSLSNSELVKTYKEAKINFMNTTEGTPEELEADRIYTELSRELNERNLDLRDYIEESNNTDKLNNKECSTLKDLNLKIGEKYTILKTDELVPLRICGTLKGYHFDRYAQYENALYIYIQRPRAKRVDEIIISIEKCFIFKGDFKEMHRKEVIKDDGNITMTNLHRWTIEDLKDDKTLVYYHDFKEEFNVNNDFDYLVDVTGEYIQNNNIKPVEAPTNENYISYIKSLLTQYNVKELKKYINNLGYRLLIQSVENALVYKLY